MTKIEFVSGTKDELPHGKNTKVKIDGKEIKGLTFISIHAEAGSPVCWATGFESSRSTLKLKLKYWLFRLRRWWNR